MAFGIITEALARIEYKIDLVLKHLKIPVTLMQPMHFVGVQCPACQMMIQYTVDPVHGVVTRQCNCKTGKVAVPPLKLPAVLGEDNARGRTNPRSDEGEDSEEPHQRPGSEAGARRVR